MEGFIGNTGNESRLSDSDLQGQNDAIPGTEEADECDGKKQMFCANSQSVAEHRNIFYRPKKNRFKKTASEFPLYKEPEALQLVNKTITF